MNFCWYIDVNFIEDPLYMTSHWVIFFKSLDNFSSHLEVHWFFLSPAQICNWKIEVRFHFGYCTFHLQNFIWFLFCNLYLFIDILYLFMHCSPDFFQFFDHIFHYLFEYISTGHLKSFSTMPNMLVSSETVFRKFFFEWTIICCFFSCFEFFCWKPDILNIITL